MIFMFSIISDIESGAFDCHVIDNGNTSNIDEIVSNNYTMFNPVYIKLHI